MFGKFKDKEYIKKYGIIGVLIPSYAKHIDSLSDNNNDGDSINNITELIKEGYNKFNNAVYDYQEKMNNKMDNIYKNVEKYKIEYKDLSDQELRNIIKEYKEKETINDQDKAKLMAIKHILEVRK